MRQVHEELGHFGLRNTRSMLRGQYWWIGMYQQVVAYGGRCEVCGLVRSNFNTLSPQLQPSPIMGLGYHLSLDFAGRWLPHDMEQNTVLVMVEHFSK